MGLILLATGLEEYRDPNPLPSPHGYGPKSSTSHFHVSSHPAGELESFMNSMNPLPGGQWMEGLTAYIRIAAVHVEGLLAISRDAGE